MPGRAHQTRRPTRPTRHQLRHAGSPRGTYRSTYPFVAGVRATIASCQIDKRALSESASAVPILVPSNTYGFLARPTPAYLLSNLWAVRNTGETRCWRWSRHFNVSVAFHPETATAAGGLASARHSFAQRGPQLAA